MTAAQRHMPWIVAVCVLASACATKGFLQNQTGQIAGKVDTLSQSLEQTQERTRQNETRIGELDMKVTAAASTSGLAAAQAQIQALKAELEALKAARQASGEVFLPPLPHTLPPPSLRRPADDLLSLQPQVAEPLAAVQRRLVQLLAKAAIVEYSTYSIGDDGFAVAARMECITAQGTPLKDRWCAGSTSDLSQGLLASLLFSPKGRYRVMVFVVTPRPFQPTGAGGIDVLKSLPEPRIDRLTPVLETTMTMPTTRAYVLIYEFLRRTYDSIPVLVRPGLDADKHLAGAGLLRQ